MADHLEDVLQAIEPRDATTEALARQRLNQLTMPHWALGRLMDLAVDLAGMTRRLRPPVTRRTIVTMAADHGVAAEGVSQYPREVTSQMGRNFAAGGAGINALARVGQARLVIVDMGVAAELSDLVDQDKILDRRVREGTDSILRGAAMTPAEARACVEVGMGLATDLGESTDVFGTGDMGIGNTTASAAIAAALTGASPEDVTGRGTGIDEERWVHKKDVVEQALHVNQPNPSDGMDVLGKVGGFEIGGLAGLILGSAALHKPIVIDGFISTAAALVAHCLCPISAEYMIFAHRSAEAGHAAMHHHLGREPLLDLGLRLGEGTGAALAMPLVDAAARILSEVSTFAEAAVSGSGG